LSPYWDFPHTVEDASGWETALHEFVLPNESALWVGFSSRSSDTPIVYKESRRLGIELAPFMQLDLLRVGKPLDRRACQACGTDGAGFDTAGAHRAQQDALMTLVLLKAQLPHITETELRDQMAPPPPNSMLSAWRSPGPKPRGERRTMDVSQFLVQAGTKPIGQLWSEDEVLWHLPAISRQEEDYRRTSCSQ
jgi:hypothetical protein